MVFFRQTTEEVEMPVLEIPLRNWIIIIIAGLLMWVIILSPFYYAFAQAEDPNEIFACMNRSGKLIVIGDEDSKREECRRREVLRSWNQEGPEGPVGPQGPQGILGEPGQDGSGFSLRDANGQYLGDILGYASSPSNESFLVKIPGTFGFVQIRQKLIYGIPASGQLVSYDVYLDGDTIFFEKENCEYNPGAVFGSFPSRRRIYPGPNGSAFKLNVAASDPLQRLMGSRYNHTNGCEPFPSNEIVVQMEEVVLPFSFPIQAPLDIQP